MSVEHTSTQSLFFGIRKLLPDSINLIVGLGCPVCVVPANEIDKAIELSLSGIKVYTFGDMFRVPGNKGSLATAQAEGGDVSVVYGFIDAINDFKSRGLREAVFLRCRF